MVIVTIASIILSLSIGSLFIAQVIGLKHNLTTLETFIPLIELDVLFLSHSASLRPRWLADKFPWDFRVKPMAFAHKTWYLISSILKVYYCLSDVSNRVSFKDPSPPTGRFVCWSLLYFALDLGIHESVVTISKKRYKISKKMGLVGMGCGLPGKSMIGIWEISSRLNLESPSLLSLMSLYSEVARTLLLSVFWLISISLIFLLRSSFLASSVS